jgi:hypothetical protein
MLVKIFYILIGIEPVTLPPEREETRYHEKVKEESIAKYVIIFPPKFLVIFEEISYFVNKKNARKY